MKNSAFLSLKTREARKNLALLPKYLEELNWPMVLGGTFAETALGAPAVSSLAVWVEYGQGSLQGMIEMPRQGDRNSAARSQARGYLLE